ncbi:MAG TPA: iron-sulfur cluster-binding domain-containing protein [Aliidongia sp.]|uniref:flavin reductase family protein n=1 Tax=Aliidongia sp. TaxID=1914230 RepID=UPI002DDD9E38|nr:iron-sulfur cluster-binding domain-containing protein [Aliidongia sp.]HEV2673603.1 iron-sulfur cluster-binding domain-containing protein [Aliidongia sp.]
MPPETGRIALTCRAIREETAAIKTFVFEPSQPMAHEAGQALALSLSVDGTPLTRTFSISSAPEDGGLIEVTVKAHAQGIAGPWLHRNLAVGHRIEARRPFGRFTLARRRPDAPLALISAGSGATPLMSMLRQLARTTPRADVTWFHTARAASEILFAAELVRLQESMPNLRVAVTLTVPGAGWFGYRGRATRRLLSVAVPDLARRDTFCCGPHGFMDEVKLIFAAEGGPPDHFHTEAFRPRSQPSAGERLPAPMADGPEFALRIGERVLGMHAGETILQAALRQGVVIPCGCGQGLCGTCRIRMVDGTVDLRHQGGISAEDEAEGFILACSSRAHSDIAISLAD